MNVGKMMKNLQKMQAELQTEIDALDVEASAGGGMVTITLSGKSEMRGVTIDPALATPDDTEVLEDLIIAAFNDAKAKVEARVQEEMSKLTGGLNLPPGMNLPFG